MALAIMLGARQVGAEPDGTARTLEDAHPWEQVASLQVMPSPVVLGATHRVQQLLVTALDSSGREFDVTHDVELVVADTRVARLLGTTLLGMADGQSEIRVSLGDVEVKTPLRVEGFERYPAVDFASDVVPLFSKLGCNNGGCHGRASGQNGFKLSVFGFDPAQDYDAIVKEARGRRLFPSSPERSLMLAKPTAQVPHGGGQRLRVGSPDYELLLEWIAQGMPRAQPGTAQLVALEVEPRERTMRLGERQQILATAVYSDGGRRDVTAAAGYSSNAPLVADVDHAAAEEESAGHAGLVRMGRVPGEAAITVHYMEQVATVQLQLPRAADGVSYPDLVVDHPIDKLVAAKLRKMNLVPSDLADDATFLRRVFLDLLGTLPSADEVRTFLADPSSDKRARCIDRLLERPEYADYWALIWADILLVDRNKLGERGAFELHRWLREQFAANRPYDAWVRELITATGNSGRNGPANFFRAVETPEELARAISQAFLGVRIECAQCHHHPFEKWSQDDFYGLAGFFTGMERKPLAPGRVLVFHGGFRETRVPLSNRLVPTHALDAPVPSDLADGDPRVLLAGWMTDTQNAWFARLCANRLWKHFLGRGLIEPEDDLRTTNPATNEPLLAYLAEQFAEGGFDLKKQMRLMLTSRTYQLSALPNATNQDDEQNFSHHYVRRLPAEVLLDAICQVTGQPENFPGKPTGTRALELWDNRLPSYFLEIFGRPERNSPCECARSSEPTMAQALHLMNAPEVEEKIASAEGRVARWLAEHAADDLEGRQRLVEEFCLAALGRPPRDKELAIAESLFQAAAPREAAEDFLWTLLNSYDFLFVQ